MRITLPPVLVPIATGLLAATVVPLRTWGELSASLLPCLSVLGAAVFVRLARGLPFNNPDHFADRKDAATTADMIITIAAALQRLVYVILVAMALVAVAAPARTFISGKLGAYKFSIYIEMAYSGALAVVISYAFVRMLQVVSSDISLAKKQREIVLGVIDRKAAKSFDDGLPDIEDRKIVGQENFGRIIQ